MQLQGNDTLLGTIQEEKENVHCLFPLDLRFGNRKCNRLIEYPLELHRQS